MDRANPSPHGRPQLTTIGADRAYVLYKTMVEWAANGPNGAFIACRKELEIAQVRPPVRCVCHPTRHRDRERPTRSLHTLSPHALSPFSTERTRGDDMAADGSGDGGDP